MGGGAGTVELDQELGTIHLNEGDETTLPSVNYDIVSPYNREVPKGFDGPEPDCIPDKWQTNIPDREITINDFITTLQSLDENLTQEEP